MAELIVVKIVKSWGGRSNEGTWSNVYHIVTEVPLNDAGIVPIANAFVNLEKVIHLQPVNFMRVVLSTAGKDQLDYPMNLRVIEVNEVGGNNLPGATSPCDLNIAFKVQKNVGMGRPGRLLYRGALLNSHLAISAGGKSTLIGDPILGGAAGVNAMQQVNALVSAATISWVLPPRNLGELPEGANTQNLRTVLNIVSSGIVISKRNHKWFDRTAPVQGAG